MTNQSGKWKVELTKQKAQNLTVYQPLLGRWTGFLGRNDGVVQNPGYPTGYVYVRGHDGSLMTMWNQHVPNIADLPIIYGYVAEEPKLLQVITQWTTYVSQPVANIPSHGATHEWPNSDTVWIHGEQFLPWLVRPNSSNPYAIDIFPGLERVGGTWVFSSSVTVDLTAHIPASGARFVIVCLQSDDTFTVVDGSTVGTPEVLGASDIPSEPAGTVVKAIVRLYTGQASIRQTLDVTDIFDPRFATGGGGTSILPIVTPFRIMIADAGGNITTNPNFATRGDGSKSPVFGGFDPAIGGDGLVHATGDGSTVAGRHYAWFLGASNQPGHTGVRGRGTPSVPAFVQSGDILEVIRGAGFGVTDIGGGAIGYALSADASSSSLWSKGELRCIADADWSSDTSWPTRWELWAVPVGSTTKQLIATFRTSGIDLPDGSNYSINTNNIIPSKRVLAANLTVPDTECAVLTEYLDTNTFDVILAGDAELMIL